MSGADDAPGLFLFGTLRHLPLLERVTGLAAADLDAVPAALPDHRVARAKGQDFPLLDPAPGRRAEGLLLRGLTPDAAARLDRYEAPYGYLPGPVVVETGEGRVAARVYRPEPGADAPEAGEDWDLGDWQARWGEIATLAAEEEMQAWAAGQDGAPRFARNARAWARIMARQHAPQVERSAMTWDDVDGPEWQGGHDGFFRLRRFTLSHPTFSGGHSERVTREGFAAFDAALVLPYDPETDRVLMIEQLRYGPILRGDPTPWVLEPVAGLVDAGEDPAETARRETVEEARLELRAIEPMVKVYASPGYSSEYFHCFLGLADLSEHHGTLGGADDEHEDIRSHVMSFDRAMELVGSGEVNAGPLVMMLLWLQANRGRLRAAS